MIQNCIRWSALAVGTLAAIAHATSSQELFPNKAGGAPGIAEEPIGRTVTAGGHVTLSLSVTGATPLVYQWWKANQPLTNDSRLSGATNFVLNIDPALTNDTGNYFAIVSNASGAVTSTPVSITVSQLVFTLTPLGGTGALVTVFGQVGDVYRVEVSENFAPFRTNGYATNFTGRAHHVYRDPGGGGFRNFRVALDHMLPVLYPARVGEPPNSFRAYGKLNQVWRIEGSTDLKQWSTITTVTNTNGWYRFFDPPLTPPPIRFYRIAPP